jgi:hypothetical protein
MTAESDAQVVLWTPQRLDERHAYWQQRVVTSSMAFVHLVNEIVEDYEAKIAALQAQHDGATGGEWVPVDANSLTYHMVRESYMLDGEPIDMFELPPTVRLCKRAEPAAAPVPTPDWVDAVHDDCINGETGNIQIRIVKDHSEKDQGLYLHVRKRVAGEWSHIGLTDLPAKWRIQQQCQGSEGGGWGWRVMNNDEQPDYRIAKPPTEGYILKPCPFCGDSHNLSLDKPGDYVVHCWACGASSTDAPNADYVIWAWNRRQSPQGD